MKEQIRWTIMHLNDKYPYRPIFNYRSEAVANFETNTYNWQKLYKMGWRAVKVKITLIKKPQP